MKEVDQTQLAFTREVDPLGLLDPGEAWSGGSTMAADRPSVRWLEVLEAEARLDELASVLVDAVQSGASVSFMPPFGHGAALEFWRRQLPALAAGEVVLFVALVEGVVRGTVLLRLTTPPNQPHRAEVAKLMVHRAARGRGLAGQLLQALEHEAVARGRSLLTLDTMTGSVAERLYRRLGWTAAGTIPDYSLFPDGTLGATTIFFKRLD
jgi:GNAT superfamily N-acetyltransferase